MEIGCSADSVRGKNCTQVQGMSLVSVGRVHSCILPAANGETFESNLNSANRCAGWFWRCDMAATRLYTEEMKLGDKEEWRRAAKNKGHGK
jgi:hypothetical protein